MRLCGLLRQKSGQLRLGDPEQGPDCRYGNAQRLSDRLLVEASIAETKRLSMAIWQSAQRLLAFHDLEGSDLAAQCREW